MKKLIILGVVALIVAIVGGSLISTYVGVRNTGRSKELAMTADYSSIEIRYGQNRESFYDQIGVSREKRNAMDKILTDVVTGRAYVKGGSVDRSALISAVAEAYPDISGLNVYDKIVAFVQQMRTQFAQDQAHMQTLVADYNSWRTTGSLLHPWFVHMAGFPSESLTIRTGDKVYHGQEALDRMSTPIIASESQQIFDTGTDQQLDLKEKK